MIPLKMIQDEVGEWAERNFGHEDSWVPLLGVMEEVGELSHSHLKDHQSIRTGEDHTALAKDAVGDIVIYLAHYCHLRSFNLEDIVLNTWDEVSHRDWKSDPVSGGESP